MGIFNKIDEIRNKPESVRLRYVWAGVIISMTIILVIWFFSMRALFSQTKSDGKAFDSLKKSFEKTQEQFPSIKDVPLPSAQPNSTPPETPREDEPAKNEGLQDNNNNNNQ